MLREIWKERCKQRIHLTSTLTHLTLEGRAEGKQISAQEVLVKIGRFWKLAGLAKGG